MHEQVKRPWNPGNAMPLRNWMNADQNKEDVQRLKTVGNIVFPKAAQLALHLLANEISSKG